MTALLTYQWIIILSLSAASFLASKPIYKITGNSKSLVMEKYVLKNISLDIPLGTIYGLIGKKGCGKSTLLRTISEILPIKDGQIYVEGKMSPIISVGAFTDGDLTAEENIDFYAEFRGMRRKDRKKFKENVLKFTRFTADKL